MLKIHKQLCARNDLKEIWLYSLKKWGEYQADKYYDLLIEGIDLIASNPKIGVARCDIREEYRCFKIKEHDVYYKIMTNRIVVVRVLHENMKPALHLR